MVLSLCKLLTVFCISGPAAAVDGDTIRVHDAWRGPVAVRLWGIDAPELDEAGGRTSRDLLADLIAHKRVVCDRRDKSHRRVVATCTIDGRDLGEAVVTFGGALDCPHYSGGRYHSFELPALRATQRRKPYC